MYLHYVGIHNNMLNSIISLAHNFNSLVNPYINLVTPPRFNNYSLFDKFLLLNLVLLLFIFLLPLFKLLSPILLYRKFMKFFFSLAFVQRKFQKEVQQMKQTIKNDLKEKQHFDLKEIPFKPVPLLQPKCEKEAMLGKMCGSRYPPGAHSQIISKLAKNPLFSCPLHPTTSPLLSHLQKDIIQMTARLIGLHTEDGLPCGHFFSGGTESIFMAVLAFRDYGFKVGKNRPNLVVCCTGHVAATKACAYMDIEIREIGYDKNFNLDVSEMKKNIDSNTILVYASYPNYPTATVDPVHQIAAYCAERKVPVHVDMCLGGFVVPFLEQTLLSKDNKMPKGVTSVSVDHHKFGLAAKGCSVLLFSDSKYKESIPTQQCLSIGVTGSMSGVGLASAWISMMKMGIKGYKQNAKALQNATRKMNKVLIELGYKTFGNPDILGFNFLLEGVPIARLQSMMKEKGWSLGVNQKPMFLRYSLTPMNCVHIDEMIEDLKECTSKVRGVHDGKVSTELQLYGACAKIPDGGTKNLLLKYLLDSFLDL